MSLIFSFDPSIADRGDWYRKYNNTVVLLNGHPANLHISDTGDSRFVSKEHGVDFVTSWINYDKEKIQSLSPWFPRPNWVYSNRGLLHYVGKYPARQWHKSYCNGTYAYQYMYQMSDRRLGPVTREEIYTYLFKPIDRITNLTPDFPTKIGKSVSGVPLTDTLAITRFEERTWGIISPSGFVGYIVPEEGRIVLPKCMRQDVLDYCNGGDFQWKFEIM